MDRYEGKGLTEYLKIFGCERKPDENDWDFRKRVFPDLWLERDDSIVAYEVLVGADRDNWTDDDRDLFGYLVSQKPGPNRTKLEEFANGFGNDPIKMREERQPVQ